MNVIWRRGVCLLLALILLGGLAGCQQDETVNTQSTEPAAESTTAPVTVATEPPTEPTEPPAEPVVVEVEPLDMTNMVHVERSQTITPDQIDWPYVTAWKAFVYDCKDQEYLYLKGEPSQAVYPASTTKLFCAYTALQYLDLDTELTTGRELYYMGEDAYHAGLRVGMTLTVRKLLEIMLIPSCSDAAHTLAVNAAKVIAGQDDLDVPEALKIFVAEMNRQAELMGIENTHFVTIDGFHNDDHYISLSAYVEIAQRCLAHPEISRVMRMPSVTFTAWNGEEETLTGSNQLVLPNGEYYRPEACGLKTGSNDEAGCCLLAAFWIGDRYVLVGVFDCPWYFGRYEDALALYDAAKPLYELTLPVDIGQVSKLPN